MGWGGERKKNCNHTLSRHVPEIFLISFPSTYIKDMETVGYIRFNNPRINKAGKGIWDYWIHPMNEHHLVNQTMALSATSSVSLNTSSFSFFMDGDPPTSLGSPFQSPVTPSVSRFFLKNPPLAQPKTVSSYPVTGCLGEEPNSHLATPLPSGSCREGWGPSWAS